MAPSLKSENITINLIDDNNNDATDVVDDDDVIVLNAPLATRNIASSITVNNVVNLIDSNNEGNDDVLILSDTPATTVSSTLRVDNDIIKFTEANNDDDDDALLLNHNPAKMFLYPESRGNTDVVNLIDESNIRVEHSSSTVVDLTSSITFPSTTPVATHIRNGTGEIEFMGSIRPSNARNGDNSILNSMTADSSEVTFVGTKRRHGQPPPPSQSPAYGTLEYARANVRRVMESNRVFTSLSGRRFAPAHSEINSSSFSAFSREAIDNFTNDRRQQARHIGSNMPIPPETTTTAKKQHFEKPSLPSMKKGEAMMVPTGFDALDMYYPHLTANDRTNVLHQLLPQKKQNSNVRGIRFSKEFARGWRVEFEKKNSRPTLWHMASSFSDHVAAKIFNIDNNANKNDHKMSAIKDDSNNEDVIRCIWGDNDRNEEEDRKLPGPIGPLTSQVIDALHTYFRAHVIRHHHKLKLDSIESIEASKANNNSTMTCSICSDDFDPINTVPCSNENEIHFFCKTCLASYVTVTVESGPIQCIKCPLPNCKSLFSVADVKANLSSWDLLMIDHRENSRDRRVALAAKAVLHCECGVVAIITEEDMGNGRVTCPGNDCNKRYCCKCGNDDHGNRPCPPSAETMQWLDKNSKECPNCKNRIEKNGGCDHMTCKASAGGCGHEFWWTCLCPYKQHKPGCTRIGELRRR